MRVRDPGDGGTAERDDGEDRGFPAAPARAHAEENQREIDPPGDEGGGDQAVIDPARAVFDVRPDDADDDADGDEDEAGAERARDQFVQRAERREQPVERTASAFCLSWRSCMR